MIKKAIELDEENLEYKIWNAQLLYKKAEYQNAISYINKIIEQGSERNDSKNLASSHSLLTSIYYDTGNYLKSIDSNRNAIKYYTEDNNQNSLFFTKNRLGGIMHAQGFHDKALEIFEDALKIAEKLEDESGSVPVSYTHLTLPTKA